MSFTERDKLKALAIVHIFETGKPLGDYSAVAVLNDGAGISYGINQFTHRSGSLAKVIDRYLRRIHDGIIRDRLPTLRIKTKAAIAKLSTDAAFKIALKGAGQTDAMQAAQREIAEKMYLRPAIKACEGSGFVLPLSLAVIYDSINHGSFEKIRDRVKLARSKFESNLEFEKAWISTYVQRRDAWLESVPRLAPTDYRTDFFLAQIERGNWQLDLPVNVHGFRLTDAHLKTPAAESPAVITPNADPQTEPTPAESTETPQDTATPPDRANVPGTQPPSVTVDAPPPTGFLGKLKKLFAGLGIGTISIATIKEVAGIRLEPGTIELLRILVPTVLVLGFVGLVVWYISEKVIGFKTLRMQSEIQSDPDRLNIEIKPS